MFHKVTILFFSILLCPVSLGNVFGKIKETLSPKSVIEKLNPKSVIEKLSPKPKTPQPKTLEWIPVEWRWYQDLPNDRLEMEHKFKALFQKMYTGTTVKDGATACPEDRASLERWYQSTLNEHKYMFTYFCQRGGTGRCSEEQMNRRFAPDGVTDDWSNCATVEHIVALMYKTGLESTKVINDGLRGYVAQTTADGRYKVAVLELSAQLVNADISPGKWSPMVPALNLSTELLQRVKDQIALQIHPNTNKVACREPGTYVKWRTPYEMMNGSTIEVEYNVEHKVENGVNYYRMPISCNDRPYQGVSFPLFQTMIEVVADDVTYETYEEFARQEYPAPILGDGDVTLVVLKTPLTYNKYFEEDSKTIGLDWIKSKADKLFCETNPDSSRCFDPNICYI